MPFAIGNFTQAKDGGWTGTIQTLKINAKVRFVPNDNRDNGNAPAFRLYVGKSRVGDAWAAKTNNENPKDYLRVTFDGPDFQEPFGAALFPSDEGNSAQLVWRRQKVDE